MDINELKKQAVKLQPVLRIGKNGINENIFVEVEKLLKKRNLVKIKILNNCPIEEKEEKQELINLILKKTRSELVSWIGNTFTIYRKIIKGTKDKDY